MSREEKQLYLCSISRKSRSACDQSGGTDRFPEVHNPCPSRSAAGNSPNQGLVIQPHRSFHQLDEKGHGSILIRIYTATPVQFPIKNTNKIKTLQRFPKVHLRKYQLQCTTTTTTNIEYRKCYIIRNIVFLDF